MNSNTKGMPVMHNEKNIEPPRQRDASRRKFFVSGVCCGSEEAQVRKKLDSVLGPTGYEFNPVTCELSVFMAINDRELIRHIRDSGFNARTKQELEQEQSFWSRHAEGVSTGVAAMFALSGISLEMADPGTWGLSQHSSGIIVHALLLAAIGVGGWRVFIKAFKAIKNLSLDMNFLMSLAVVGAILIDKWSEGAAVMVLFSVSLMLESYSASRTRKAVQSLMKLSPDRTSLLKDGKEVLTTAYEVHPGDIIVIRPGERIPLDGTVVEGSSSVNQAPITGESIPVVKEVGTSVYAGSMNERGSIKVEVTREFEDTTLAHIVHLIEDAQRSRAPIQTFVEKFAQVYTPAVLGLAILVMVVPPLLLQEPFIDWLYRALVLLVIACPCALVISTPVSLVSALTNAARRGILIKGGKHLETLSTVNAIAFDKTGTLTEGKLTVTDIVPLNSSDPEWIFGMAAAIEHRSEHHLASAVVAKADLDSIPYAHIEVDEFEALPGKGVKATVGGARYFVGNHQLCHEQASCSPNVERALERFANEGKTVIVLGRERETLGIIALQDTARHQTRAVIEELYQLGMKQTVMLSGDNDLTAQRMAHALGITHYDADLLPDQKVKRVNELKSQHGTVAMVGDGVNDAPALAASSVGIAMGISGTDTALYTADVVLTSDDLSKLPHLFRLSKKAIAIVKQNIAIALSLKLVFVILSVSGFATLWLAVLADDGAALAVILNGLRLLSFDGRLKS